jgi:hypothetical protein
MCGGNQSQVAQPVSASMEGTLVKSAPPLPGKMDVPVPDVSWTPSIIGSEKGRSFIQALTQTKRIALLLPKKLRNVQEFETRVFQMLSAAAPEAKIVVQGEAPDAGLLNTVDEIPNLQPALTSSADTLVPPTLVPKGDSLSVDWLSKKKFLKDADTILIIRPIQMNAARLNEMRSIHEGGCDELEKPLKTAVDNSVNYFDPYISWASDLLRREFAKQLTSSLALWRNELQQAGATARPNSLETRCIESYTKFLDKYEACFNGSCTVAPCVFPTAGGILGMVDESGSIPDSCPREGMRNFALEMKGLGERAMYEVLPSLQGNWTNELVRQGALERIQSGIKDACAPRHRRIEQGDVEPTRTAVEAYLTDLKNGDFPSEWEPMFGKERVIGKGPVDVLARVKPLVSNPSVQGLAVIGKIRALDRCQKGADYPIQAAVINVATSQVLYMGVFFEEALLCEDLPPR